MTRPKLLDLFAGHQGTGVGFARAGFEVTSIDVEPHERHPEIAYFHTADAMQIVANPEFLRGFDVVAGGPPCQGYSHMAQPGNDHPRLIAPLRRYLKAWGGPYVIENIVSAAPELDHPVQVCGQALGLGVRRHRLFESNVFLFGTGCYHPAGVTPIGVYGEHPDETTYLRTDGTSRGQRARTLAEGQAAMGIDWMVWEDLTEAIPPAYTEFIGEQILDQL